MEKFEEKIIDLVDIVSEPDPNRPGESIPASDAPPLRTSPTGIETSDLESLVRKEVERLIKSTIDENIQKMIREILVQEVQKAIAREMESLKRT
ncbi:MAG: hypothetical protein HY787_13830 [Deltaproteobacteria bacterium]|nr:hypothetical protein [Deltaproteobacteria bacterium]